MSKNVIRANRLCQKWNFAVSLKNLLHFYIIDPRIREDDGSVEIPAFARMTIFFRCSCGDTLHFEKSLRLLTQSVREEDRYGPFYGSPYLSITCLK